MASPEEPPPRISATERIRLKRLQKQSQEADGASSSSSAPPPVSPQSGGIMEAVTPGSDSAAGPSDVPATAAQPEATSSDHLAHGEDGALAEGLPAPSGTSEEAEEDVTTPTLGAPDLAAVAAQDEAFLQQMVQSKQRLEAEVAVKKEFLTKTIQERFDQACREQEILNMVRKELGKVDEDSQTDIDMLRAKIDETVKRLGHARVRYERAETEFMNSKMDLQVKKNNKTLLTEHLTLLIQQNEQRKAEKLEELMTRLEIGKDEIMEDLKKAAEAKAAAPAAMPTPPTAPTPTPPAATAVSDTATPASTPVPPTDSSSSVTATAPAAAPSLPTAVPPPTGPTSPVAAAITPTSPASAGPAIGSPTPVSPASGGPTSPAVAGKGKGKGPPPGYRAPMPGKGGPPPGKGGPPFGKGGPSPGKGKGPPPPTSPAAST